MSVDTPLTLRWWNLAQTFTQTDPSKESSPWPVDSAAGAKAALWDVDGPSLTLTSARPSLALVKHGLVPTQRYADLPQPDCADRWLDTEAGGRLLEIARQAGTIRLAPGVWTRQVDSIRRVFEKQRIAVEVETACPHGRVFHWNTRVGMRDLFLSIPSIAAHLPPSLVCHDATHVKTAASRLGGKTLLVKSNFALGGLGTVILPTGGVDPSKLVELIAAHLPEPVQGKGKAFAWAWREEPFVVEQFEGSLKTNISVTLDARQICGATEILGCSEQLIEDGFAYAGIRSLEPALEARHQPQLTLITEAVGQALATRGFAGCFNLDFVLTQDGRCFLVDLNVRRSAPLDLHRLLARLLARCPTDWLCYQAIEQFGTVWESEAAIGHALASEGLAFDGRTGVLPLCCPYPCHASGGFRVPLLLLATDEAGLLRLADGIHRVC